MRAANNNSPLLFHPETSLLCNQSFLSETTWGDGGCPTARTTSPVPGPWAHRAALQDHATLKKPEKQGWQCQLRDSAISMGTFLMVPV